VERPLPSEEDVAAVVSERVTALLEAELRSRGALNRERMQRFDTLAKSLGELDDVMAMLLDDFYHKSLHEPLVPPPPPHRETRRRGRRRR
jgi:ATP-dependent RNA helicase DeaD